MKWDRFDSERIFQLIDEAWPNAKPLTDDEKRMMQYALPYPAATVMDAIQEVYATRTAVSRPGCGAFTAAVNALLKAERRGAEQARVVCNWCLNTRMVSVNVYLVSGEEAMRRGLRETMIRKQQKGPLFLVDPRVAAQTGLAATVVQLYCGHCAWSVGTMAVIDFTTVYEHFVQWADQRSAWAGLRCLEPGAPAIPPPCRLSEAVGGEPIDEGATKLLERVGIVVGGP
jgi:hypothetical protein